MADSKDGGLFLPLAIGLGVALVSTRASAAPPKKGEEEPNSASEEEGKPGTGGQSTAIENAINAAVNFVTSPAGLAILGSGLSALGIGGAATGGAAAGGAATTGGAAAGGAATTTPATVQTGSVAIQAGFGATPVIIVGIVIVVIIIAIIVTDDVIKKQKTWASRLRGLFPNARDLTSYELGLLEAFVRNTTKVEGGNDMTLLGGNLVYHEGGVRDFRLDKLWVNPENPKERLVLQGWRPVVRFVPTRSQPWMGADAPSKAWLRLQRQARRLALEYLEFRYWLANNLLTEGRGTPDFGFFLNDLFNGDVEAPNLGGLGNVPFPDGQTQYSARIEASSPGAISQVRSPLYKDYLIGRRDKIPYGTVNILDGAKEAKPSTEELVARDATPDSSFIDMPGGGVILKAQRFKALLEVLQALALHPGVVMFDVFDPRGWRDDVLRWLSLGEDFVSPASNRPADVFNRRKDDYLSWCIVTNPVTFGVRAVIDVWQLRFPGTNEINPFVRAMSYKMFPPFKNPLSIASHVWFLDASRQPGDPEYFTPAV